MVSMFSVRKRLNAFVFENRPHCDSPLLVPDEWGQLADNIWEGSSDRTKATRQNNQCNTNFLSGKAYQISRASVTPYKSDQRDISCLVVHNFPSTNKSGNDDFTARWFKLWLLGKRKFPASFQNKFVQINNNRLVLLMIIDRIIVSIGCSWDIFHQRQKLD